MMRAYLAGHGILLHSSTNTGFSPSQWESSTTFSVSFLTQYVLLVFFPIAQDLEQIDQSDTLQVCSCSNVLGM